MRTWLRDPHWRFCINRMRIEYVVTPMRSIIVSARNESGFTAKCFSVKQLTTWKHKSSLGGGLRRPKFRHPNYKCVFLSCKRFCFSPHNSMRANPVRAMGRSFNLSWEVHVNTRFLS